MIKARKIGEVQKLIRDELEVKPWSKEVQAQVYYYVPCFLFLSRSTSQTLASILHIGTAPTEVVLYGAVQQGRINLLKLPFISFSFLSRLILLNIDSLVRI